MITALLLVLSLTSLPVLFFNESRGLFPRPSLPWGQSHPSYLTRTANERLFKNQEQALGPYQSAVDSIVYEKVSQIGLVLGPDSWEYPIWRLLRDRKLDYSVRIEHVAPAGSSHWPLGTFAPDVLFWSHGEAPASLAIDGKVFLRNGPPGAVAVFYPSQYSLFKLIVFFVPMWANCD